MKSVSSINLNGYLGFSSSCTNTYRFGFNGHEKDGEALSGNAGNQLDFGARIYDSRLVGMIAGNRSKVAARNFAYARQSQPNVTE